MRKGIPIIFGMLFFFSCGNSPEDIAAFDPGEKLPQLISTDIIIEYSDSAVLKARIKAPLVKEYGPPENYTVIPHGLHVDFFAPNGKVTSVMKADSAIIRRGSDIMEAYRNVSVENEMGERLETDELYWFNSPNPQDRQLVTNSFVKIFKGDEVIFGEGLKANESFTKARIIRPQGNFYLNENEGGSDFP